jgi:hypothetical protein
MDTNDQPRALKFLRHRGYRVHGVWVQDGRDRSIAVNDRVQLIDPETGQAVRVRMDRSMIRDYLEALEAHDRGVDATCRRHEVPLVRVSVDDEVEAATLRVLRESPWCR